MKVKPIWTFLQDEVKGDIFVYREKGKRIYQGYATTKNCKVRFRTKTNLKEAQLEIQQYHEDYMKAKEQIKKQEPEPININGALLFACGIIMGILGLLLWAARESMQLLHR